MFYINKKWEGAEDPRHEISFTVSFLLSGFIFSIKRIKKSGFYICSLDFFMVKFNIFPEDFTSWWKKGE